jgi:signal transduction histidine kinase
VNQAVLADRWRAGIAGLRRSGSPPPRLSRWAWAADIALAVVLAVGTLRYTLSAGDTMVIFPKVPEAPPAPHLRGVSPGYAILAVLTAAPLAVRRRYPLTAFCAVVLVTLLFQGRVQSSDTAVFTFASCLIAAYSAAMYSPYRVRAIVAVFIGAVLIATRHDTVVPDISAGYVPLLVLVAFALGANTIHTWKQRVAQLQAKQEEATRQAVMRERARIARELHDVVTHNVAVMVVQAGAARKVIDAAPDQARDALLAVEAGGRAALAELRHVMGLLTMSSDDPDSLAPQPGLDQLAMLTDRVRDAGVPVELAVTGTPGPLPTGVDLAAYRVIQESLTNAVKHAVGAHVQVSIDYGADALNVEVTDTGGGPTQAVGAGDGRGLIGLRERLAVYGGTLQAGPRPTGGFRVRATIPVQQ